MQLYLFQKYVSLFKCFGAIKCHCVLLTHIIFRFEVLKVPPWNDIIVICYHVIQTFCCILLIFSGLSVGNNHRRFKYVFHIFKIFTKILQLTFPDKITFLSA